MADEQQGMGVHFYRYDKDADPSPDFEQLCNITQISGPSYTRDTLETTDLCSTDGFRTFIGGLRDAGEVTLSFNYSKEIWDKLYEDYLDDENNDYGIHIPAPNEMGIEFNGVLTGPPLEIPRDDLITVEVTIKVSGKPTIGSTWPVV